MSVSSISGLNITSIDKRTKNIVYGYIKTIKDILPNIPTDIINLILIYYYRKLSFNTNINYDGKGLIFIRHLYFIIIIIFFCKVDG